MAVYNRVIVTYDTRHKLTDVRRHLCMLCVLQRVTTNRRCVEICLDDTTCRQSRSLFFVDNMTTDCYCYTHSRLVAADNRHELLIYELHGWHDTSCKAIRWSFFLLDCVVNGPLDTVMVTSTS